MMLKALIIDDEEYIREDLKVRIRTHFDDKILIIDEANSVKSGAESIKTNKPDLVFLDIDLGDGTGFDLITGLSNIDFQIIFVTGFDHHAIKAIKIGALDYVLKPVDDDEFNEAVNKAIDVGRKHQTLEKGVSISNHFYKESKQEKVVLRTLDAHHVVYLKDILYCNSEGNYTTFYLPDEKIMISKPLKKAEELLDPELFLKCHQSYLVNVSYVTKYTNEGFLILKSGAQIPVASRRKESVLERLF